MFCSVKKGKDSFGNTYKFYLCERYRDKETGKVKSSDTYIMTLQEEDFRDIKISYIVKHLDKILKEKNILNEKVEDLIYDKFLDIREDILEKDRLKQEEEYKQKQKEYEKYREAYNSYSSNFSSGMSSINFDDTTKDIAKEFIKLGFKAMAKKYHPDLTRDNGEKMKLINEVKEKLENVL